MLWHLPLSTLFIHYLLDYYGLLSVCIVEVSILCSDKLDRFGGNI